MSDISDIGEGKKEALRLDFNRLIKLGFEDAMPSSETGFLLFRDIDEHFGIIEEIADDLLESQSPAHQAFHCPDDSATGLSDGHRLRRLQRGRLFPGRSVIQLFLDNDTDFRASQSMLSRVENDILGNAEGLKQGDRCARGIIPIYIEYISKCFSSAV